MAERLVRRRVLIAAVAVVFAVGAALATFRAIAGPPAEAGSAKRPAPSASAESRACGTLSEDLVPSCGALLGIWPRTRDDGTMTRDLAGNLASVENRLGRKLRLVSRYYGWGELPPDDTDRKWRDGGRLLLVDLRARNFRTNQYVQWRDIANGSHDTYLTQVATRVKAYGSKLFFSFNQEPEQELERGSQIAGTAQDFVAAYRHIHDLFDRAGATNVVWVWWIMGYLGHLGWYHALYPGDRYVDWISYDPYDFNECRKVPYETPKESVLPFLNWLDDSGLAAGKPVMLSEFGSHGINRGAWYREFGRVVKTAPRIKAVVAFNSNPGTCDTRITASRDNWQGFASLATDPYFNPPIATG